MKFLFIVICNLKWHWYGYSCIALVPGTFVVLPPQVSMVVALVEAVLLTLAADRFHFV
jgi:hypothetical protein